MKFAGRYMRNRMLTTICTTPVLPRHDEPDQQDNRQRIAGVHADRFALLAIAHVLSRKVRNVPEVYVKQERAWILMAHAGKLDDMSSLTSRSKCSF